MRKLHNVVAHAALMVQGEEIELEDISVELSTNGDSAGDLSRIFPAYALLQETLQVIDGGMITPALVRTGGAQTRSAKSLGISRSLLQYNCEDVRPPS